MDVEFALRDFLLICFVLYFFYAPVFLALTMPELSLSQRTQAALVCLVSSWLGYFLLKRYVQRQQQRVMIVSLDP